MERREGETSNRGEDRETSFRKEATEKALCQDEATGGDFHKNGKSKDFSCRSKKPVKTARAKTSLQEQAAGTAAGRESPLPELAAGGNLVSKSWQTGGNLLSKNR